VAASPDPAQHRLLIVLQQTAQQGQLLAFLHDRGYEAAADGDTNVAVDECDRRPPGLATLVANVEEWRASAHVLEAMLQLGDQRTYLRTEA
jgi:hypothetical protein